MLATAGEVKCFGPLRPFRRDDQRDTENKHMRDAPNVRTAVPKRIPSPPPLGYPAMLRTKVTNSIAVKRIV